MNREIKFRGKVLDEPNTWVYGYLASNKTIFQYQEQDKGCCGIGTFTVDEDTVGQFTGLCDKNGVEIYEGDIVKYKDSTGPHTEIVNYEKGCFYAGKHNGSSTRVSPKLINTKITEVIGNIYENKELLEANNE